MIGRLKTYAALIGLVIMALLASWLKGKKAGQDAAKLKDAQDAVEGYEIRNEVENRIARERNARQRLHDEWSE